MTPGTLLVFAGRYSLLDQSGAELLAQCAARDVGVILGGVFNTGVLIDPDAHPTYDYAAAINDLDLSLLTFDYLQSSGACIVGGPERCLEVARRYDAADCDLLLCLLNPYKISHESVMHSIELLGEHVIPHLSD